LKFTLHRQSTWHQGCLGNPPNALNKKNRRIEMEQSVSEIINELKMDFFDWCSMLSLDEICSNRKLISVAERLERMLLAAAL
jgi:hypothetical protein